MKLFSKAIRETYIKPKRKSGHISGEFDNPSYRPVVATPIVHKDDQIPTLNFKICSEAMPPPGRLQYRGEGYVTLTFPPIPL